VSDERWLPVNGYEGLYEVSDRGRIRRVVWPLNPYCDTKGYEIVALYRDGNPRTLKVHRIVARAFHGFPPDGTQVNHIDGNKRNNAAENLEWVTGHENILHAHRTGLAASTVGELHPQAKLTERDVLAIRTSDATNPVLAAIYGVTYQAIYRVRKRLTWKHV
jgi:hypothetical protein